MGYFACHRSEASFIYRANSSTGSPYTLSDILDSNTSIPEFAYSSIVSIVLDLSNKTSTVHPSEIAMVSNMAFCCGDMATADMFGVFFLSLLRFLATNPATAALTNTSTIDLPLNGDFESPLSLSYASCLSFAYETFLPKKSSILSANLFHLFYSRALFFIVYSIVETNTLV